MSSEVMLFKSVAGKHDLYRLPVILRLENPTETHKQRNSFLTTLLKRNTE